MKLSKDTSYSEQVWGLRQRARSVLHHYGLDSAQLTLLKHGENTTFRVRTSTLLSSPNRLRPPSETFVLRMHRQRYQHLLSILSELSWLSALHSNTEIKLPEAVPTLDGSPVAITLHSDREEPQYCVLFRWIDGRVFRPQDNLTLPMIQRLAALMGELHNHAARFPLTPNFLRPIWDWEGLLGNGFAFRGEEHPESYSKWDANVGSDWIERITGQGNRYSLSGHDRTILEGASERVREAMAKIDISSSAYGLIHADLNYNNYLFYKNEIRVIDFDDCGWGYHMYDMAVPLFWLRHHKEFAKITEAFCTGYQQVRSLPECFEAQLRTFMFARQLVLVRWFTGRQDNPKLQQRALAFTQQAVEELKEFNTES